MHLLPRLGCDETSTQYGLVNFDAYTDDALLIGSRHYRQYAFHLQYAWNLARDADDGFAVLVADAWMSSLRMPPLVTKLVLCMQYERELRHYPSHTTLCPLVLAVRGRKVLSIL